MAPSRYAAVSSKAAYLMNQRCYHEAIELLGAALTTIQNEVLPAGDFKEKHNTVAEIFEVEAPDSLPSFSSTHRILYPARDVPSYYLSVDTRGSVEGNLFNIFDRAFVLATMSSTFANTLDLLQVSSAVLLFNMGLAYHQAGLHEGNCGMLRNALRIYETVLGVMGHMAVNFSVDCKGRAELNLLLTALLNNTTFLYYHFMERENTIKFRHILTRILLSSVDRDEMACADPEFYRYLTTVIFACDPHKALNVAPAA
ncbi:predicted protein [Phaeodactylum tricornutum CCAP 1055/1]|jgi:hypothetical protein|uniref:Uncharacterized protein n=1 Tax=Phaeodactylum tricornutum (strain CCAP 1055/1) TaxID=556484 RepID=B7G9W2_PHATC|nr:predicted protein [Phaeodactylum tricornutum CCAP 1055/1]EEC44630.1 predicted protein [Phaeodactylum tricornutum CCAP 1055/1]|eukprot:XP_002183961.1 predicted protein [Phaeodactylum tricornutum CCAP 1055/1]